MHELPGPSEPDYSFDTAPAETGAEYPDDNEIARRNADPDLLPTEIASEVIDSEAPRDEAIPVANNDDPHLPLPLVTTRGGETYDPLDDPTLVTLIAHNRDILGGDAVGRIFTATDRFNEPGERIARDGTVVFDAFNGHKMMLQKLPGYLDTAAQAGVSPEDAEGLLTHLLNSVEIPMQQMCDRIPDKIAEVLAVSANREEPVTADDITALKELITTYTDWTSMATGPLTAVGAARVAGLSIRDSAAVVQEYITTGNARQASSYIGSLIKAFDVLSIAQADPALVQEVFGDMVKVHAEERHHTYKQFEQTIGIGMPATGRSANEILSQITSSVRAGASIDTALHNILILDARGIAAGETSSTPDKRPQQERDKAFIHKSGALTHNMLPYQTRRPLNDGLRDIENMTDAWFSNRKTPVAEGAWIFDPNSGTWYSYGGETFYEGEGSARSTAYLRYNVSDLSDQPLSFHIHPTAHANNALSKMGFLFPTNTDYRYVADRLSQAKGDIRMRSFISHEHGVTEFTYPDDPEAVRQISSVFSAIRDGTIDDFFATRSDFANYISSIGTHQGAINFIGQVNERLPDGFRLKIYPRGVDLEALIRGDNPREDLTT